jgi:hypothetical protein
VLVVSPSPERFERCLVVTQQVAGAGEEFMHPARIQRVQASKPLTDLSGFRRSALPEAEEARPCEDIRVVRTKRDGSLARPLASPSSIARWAAASRFAGLASNTEAQP